MRRFETLTLIQLIDKLAETTENYSKAFKENRNSDEHIILRDEIHQLIAEIDVRRNSNETPSSNPILPGYQFLFIKEW